MTGITKSDLIVKSQCSRRAHHKIAYFISYMFTCRFSNQVVAWFVVDCSDSGVCRPEIIIQNSKHRLECVHVPGYKATVMARSSITQFFVTKNISINTKCLRSHTWQNWKKNQTNIARQFPSWYNLYQSYRALFHGAVMDSCDKYK